MRVIFNIYRSMSYLEEFSTYHMIDVIDRIVTKHAEVVLATDYQQKRNTKSKFVYLDFG